MFNDIQTLLIFWAMLFGFFVISSRGLGVVGDAEDINSLCLSVTKSLLEKYDSKSKNPSANITSLTHAHIFLHYV